MVALLVLVWTGVWLGQRSRRSWRGSSCETAVKSARRPPCPALLTTAGGSGTYTFVLQPCSALKCVLPKVTWRPCTLALPVRVPRHVPYVGHGQVTRTFA